MINYKSFQFAFAAAAAMGLSLTACSDDVTEVTEIHQDGMAVLEAGEKLSKQACDTANVGEMLFVADSSEVFFCDGESWQTLKGADGVDGKDGDAGKDGSDGDNGTSCTATVNQDGNFDLVCGGQKVGTIMNGKDGLNGDNGTSCTATVNQEGNFDLVCGGQKVGTIMNGKDGLNGDNGTSCTATVNQDGNFDLVCGGQKVGTITNGKDGSNGNDGTSCTATVNQDGNFDLVCGGQKVGTITNGKDGRNGNDGTSCTAKSVKNAAGLEGVEVTCGGAVVDTIWNGNDGVGCSVKDGGDGSVTLTCGEGKTTLYKAMCGATAYDPTKAFCSEGKLYSCDDKPYDPAKSFCSEGELFSCDDKPYDPAKSFCSEGELFSCNGKPYDPLKSFCSDDELFSCDDKPYDPKKQYCLEVTRDGSDIYSVEELLTDARDEQNIQVYKTVKICNDDETSCQTWMAENLNYSVNPGEQSWCGGGEKKTTNEGDCSVYGRLYTWAVAVGKLEDECGYGHECDLIDAKNEKGEVRGVCPEGWHLPSYDEWDALITAVGDKAGQKLKAESDLWNYHEGISNDDSYGFSALPAGARDYNGDFVSAGDFAIFWSASGDSSDYAYRVLLYYYGESADLSYGNKNFSFSVRCLQNN